MPKSTPLLLVVALFGLLSIVSCNDDIPISTAVKELFESELRSVADSEPALMVPGNAPIHFIDEIADKEGKTQPSVGAPGAVVQETHHKQSTKSTTAEKDDGASLADVIARLNKEAQQANQAKQETKTSSKSGATTTTTTTVTPTATSSSTTSKTTTGAGSIPDAPQKTAQLYNAANNPAPTTATPYSHYSASLATPAASTSTPSYSYSPSSILLVLALAGLAIFAIFFVSRHSKAHKVEMNPKKAKDEDEQYEKV